VDSYPNRLHELLASLSPRRRDSPTIVVLTPSIYNSAYFEHVFLARQMGAHLIEVGDLVVDSDDCVCLRTVAGPVRVDVIYRRVDDLFLDPEVFRPDSVLGVPGLIRAWRAGNVAIANAPGSTRRLAGAARQRLRERPSMGGLGRDVRPLPAHPRHTADRGRLRPARDRQPRAGRAGRAREGFGAILAAWLPLTYALNAVSRAWAATTCTRSSSPPP
jgi:hypothetical protein